MKDLLDLLHVCHEEMFRGPHVMGDRHQPIPLECRSLLARKLPFQAGKIRVDVKDLRNNMIHYKKLSVPRDIFPIVDLSG